MSSSENITIDDIIAALRRDAEIKADLADALNDMMQWVAAFAQGRRQLKEVTTSDRYQRAARAHARSRGGLS